ncbi:MAG: SpoIIE family protein phosphatase [Pirellulaceae bacterium]
MTTHENSANGPVILMVDDNPTNLQVLFQTLQPDFGERCQLLVAHTGEEAIKTAGKTRPDLILLDIMMPGMDGFETCRRIKSDPHIADAAVVFMSALNETNNKVKGLELGAVDYITKPFQAEEVIARVSSHLMIHQLTVDLQKKNEELSLINHRMKRDLDAAARIQQTLLPERDLQIPGCNVAWRNVPCDELAGDSLNIFPINERYVVAWLLDSSGHGVPASLLSVAATRSLMPNHLEESLVLRWDAQADGWAPEDPASVAEKLNQMFPMEQNGMNFFSLLYGLIDMQESKVTIVSAGHPGPIVVRPDGTITSHVFPGHLIGMFEDARFDKHDIPLAPGERVVFLSDGVVEQLNKGDEPFEQDRLLDVLKQTARSDIAESVDQVISTLRNWAGRKQFNDDVSLLAFELQA